MDINSLELCLTELTKSLAAKHSPLQEKSSRLHQPYLKITSQYQCLIKMPE